jgi:hypothetical protein
MASNASIPLIFDSRGDFGLLAQKNRAEESRPDVPEELLTSFRPDSGDHSASPHGVRMIGTEEGDQGDKEEGDGRDGDALLSPREFYHQNVPRKVLVEFRDVFGSSGGKPTSTPGQGVRIRSGTVTGPSHSSPLHAPPRHHALHASSSTETNGQDPLDKHRLWRDESLAESFSTFGGKAVCGRRQSRPGTEGEEGEEDDTWEYTLSAYGSDEEISYSSPKLRRSAFTRIEGTDRTHSLTIDPLTYTTRELALHLPRIDSPLSIAGTELVTPDHTTHELPRSSFATTSSSFSTGTPDWIGNTVGREGGNDTPTPRPFRPLRSDREEEEQESEGSKLGLQLGSKSDSGESTRETRLPMRGTPHTKGRKRSPTLAESIPTLPNHARSMSSQHVPLLVTLHKPKSLSTLSSKTPRPPIKSSKHPVPLSLPTIKSTPPPPSSDDILANLVVKALKSIPKQTTITVQVDQESTREHRTTLKYMRIHKPQVFRNREIRALEEAALWCESPTRVEMFQQSGCVEFGMDPKQRAKWTFHHAVSRVLFPARDRESSCFWLMLERL